MSDSTPVLDDKQKALWENSYPELDWQEAKPSTSYQPGSFAGTISGTLSTTVNGTLSASATLDTARPETRKDPTNNEVSSQATASQPRTASIRFGPGQVIEEQEQRQYKIIETLGEGGMGVVYRAEQQSLGREVALKTLRQGDAQSKQGALFLSEARVTGRLDHPNIVPVHDLGRGQNDQYLLAMKLISGHSWADVLDPEAKTQGTNKDFALNDHLEILLNVCNAVEYAHDKGIVHCDLKPENVMIGHYGEVLVLDWGIAVDVRPPDQRSDAAAPGFESVTSPRGTPTYMSPELAEGRGADISERTDVYLLGAILHEILTGRAPHRGRNLMVTIVKATVSQAPVFDDSVPAELAKICTRALAAKPAQRYESVKEFRQAVKAYLQHRESIQVAHTAEQALENARELWSGPEGRADRIDDSRQIYNHLAASVYGFKQALKMWDQNQAASDGLLKARQTYARCALSFGDFGQAGAQCAQLPEGAEREALAREIQEAIDAREQSQTLARRLKWFGVLSLIALFTTIAVALFTVEAARREEHQQRERADQATRLAKDERDQALAAQKQASAAKQLAEEQRNRAVAGRKVAHEALSALIYDVRKSLEKLPYGELRPVRERLLDRARDGLNELREIFASEDAYTRDYLVLVNELARLEEARGRIDAARAHRQKEVEIARKRLAQIADHVCLLDLSKSLKNLGELERTQARYKVAEAHFKEALKHMKTVLNAAQSLASRLDVVLLLGNLGQTYFDAGNISQAQGYYRKALDILTEEAKTSPEVADNDKYQQSLMCIYDALVDISMRLGQFKEALKDGESYLALAAAQVKKNPKDHTLHYDYAVALIKNADVYKMIAQTQESLKRHRQAMQTLESLVSKDSNNAKFLHALSLAYEKVGTLELVSQRATGQIEPAQKLLKKGLDIAEKLAKADPNNMLFVREHYVLLAKMGNVFIVKQDPKQGLAYFEKACDIQRQIIQKTPNNVRALMDLSIILDKCAEMHLGLGQAKKAEALIEESLKMSKAMLERDKKNRRAIENLVYAWPKLAQAKMQLGKSKEALAVLAEARTLINESLKSSPDIEHDHYAQNWLYKIYKVSGKTAGETGDLKLATSLFEQGLKHCKTWQKYNPKAARPFLAIGDTLVDFAEMLWAHGLKDQAIERMTEGLKALTKHPSPNVQRYVRDKSVQLEQWRKSTNTP